MSENKQRMETEELEIKKLKRLRANARVEVKSAVGDVVSLLRSKERELWKELRSASERQATDEAFAESGQDSTQMYQQHCEFIDQALQSESEVDMYDMYQVCLLGYVKSMDNTESDTRKTPVVGEVKFFGSMEPLEKAVTEMGKVDVTYMKKEILLSRKKTDDEQINLSESYFDLLNVHHKEDVWAPDPVAVLAFKVNGVQTVVVADSGNKCVKSVYRMDGKGEMSRVTVPGRPQCVARLTGNMVAATLFKSDKIVVVDVKPELVLVSSLKVSGIYNCLTTLPDNTLVAGLIQRIDILDYGGNVLKCFRCRDRGLRLIDKPLTLCTTREGNILAFDLESEALYCLTLDGHLAFTYKPKVDSEEGWAEGIAITASGDILSTETDEKRIYQLTSDGTFVRYILTERDGLKGPRGLYVDEDNKLYVCDAKCVKVFKFD